MNKNKILLYPKFLTDSEQYEASINEWKNLWNSIDIVKRSGWKTPWLDSSMQDGNPIFSALSLSYKKGIRIIQHNDTSTFVSWENIFAKNTLEEIKELIIDCALTTEHRNKAYELIILWLK